MELHNKPVNAVKACLNIQSHTDEFNKTHQTAIKTGAHQGSCITVNLNNIMDYFGTAVNLAARLHATSTGEDFVLSEKIICDLEVADLIKNYTVTQDTEHVKGIGATINFYRIQAK